MMLATRLLIMSMAAGVPFLAPLTHTLVRTFAPEEFPADFGVDVIAPSAALWGIGAAALLATSASMREKFWPLLSLLAVACVGSIFAPRTELPLLPYILGASCFLAARRMARDRRQVEKYLRLTVLVAVLVALYALLQAFWNRIFTEVTIFLPFGSRISSTMGNPTFLADYLAMHAPLAAGLCLSSMRRISHVLWSLCAALLLTALLLTGSKGGQLAAAIAVSLLMGHAALRGAIPLSRLYLPTILMGLAIAAIALYTSSLSQALQRWISPAERFSFSQRVQIAAGGATLLSHAPILGNGAGSLPVLFPRFQPETLNESLGVGLYVNHAHNDYLEVACDLGLAGLGLLLLIGIASSRTPRPGADGLRFSLLAAGICMAANFLIFIPSSAFFVWTHAGLLAPLRSAPNLARLPLRAFRGLLGVSLALLAFRCMLAGGWFSVGAAELEKGRPSAAIASLRKAALFAPANRHIFQQLGRARELEGEIGPAIAAFERARALGPHHPITHLNLGRLYRRRFRISGDPADRERALESLDRSIRANAYQIDAREWGGELALEAGRLELAGQFLGSLPAGLGPSPSYFWLRARWLNRRGMQEEALQAMERGDLLAASLDLRRAEAALAAGNAPEAERLLRALAQRSPSMPAVWEALGYVLSTVGRHAQARECFERMAELEPKSLAAHLNVAITSLNLMEFEPAEEAIRRALALAGDNNNVLLTLARLRAGQARYAEARKEYERLLMKDPGNEQARSELRRLPR